MGLAKANAELILDLQCCRPVKTATLDIDGTVIACDKRAAKRAYDGNRGYQPVLALWVEQDVIVADKFCKGNVSAGTGTRRVVEKAVGRHRQIYPRGESALYKHELMGWLDEQAIGHAISGRHEPAALPVHSVAALDHWKLHREETDAIREWAEVHYLPCDGIWKKDAVPQRAAISPSVSTRARASCWATATGCAPSVSSPTVLIPKAA